MKKQINIGILGLGTIGSGTYSVLNSHKSDYVKRVGAKIAIKKIAVKSLNKKRLVKVPKSLLTTDVLSIVNNPEIDVVVELMGGINPAKDLILKALKNKKHVVTANKELLANYGKQIFDTAAKNDVDIYFEASVGGGIPIIRPLKRELAANRIIKVMGIVNGTTNYILTKMADEGSFFEQALSEAQAKGYAEANPKADVDGYDAAAKIAILASIAFNSRVVANQVFTEGIRAIKPQDIEYARDMNHVIKLIALAKENKEGLDVRVHPTMIPVSHPLAAVSDVYNAIFVEGDAVGEVMFFGQGAGGKPTASAVVGDIIDIAGNIIDGRTGKMKCTCYNKKQVMPVGQIISSYYLRMKVADKPGVLAKIARVFGDKQVSIGSVIQKGHGGKLADLVFITHQTKEKNLRAALMLINSLDEVSKTNNVIRVEG
ncbi:MAG: homoserine dehydrogenase [Actinobacteria bacterium]|nr:MAG: homoserine dehydrogenase [Actinomycetota bacterium]